MGLTQNPLAGRSTTLSADSVTGLHTQNPASTQSTVGGLPTTGTVEDAVAVGQEFTMIGRVGIDENSPAAATTYTTDFFSKNAPFKFRILEVILQIVDLTAADFTDGDGGNLDFTVQDGDGAESETFTDVLADQTLDDDFENGETVRYPHATVFLTNTTIDVNESLRAQLIVDPDATAGATNDGAMVDCIVRCMRVL